MGGETGSQTYCYNKSSFRLNSMITAHLGWPCSVDACEPRVFFRRSPGQLECHFLHVPRARGRPPSHLATNGARVSAMNLRASRERPAEAGRRCRQVSLAAGTRAYERQSHRQAPQGTGRKDPPAPVTAGLEFGESSPKLGVTQKSGPGEDGFSSRGSKDTTRCTGGSREAAAWRFAPAVRKVPDEPRGLRFAGGHLGRVAGIQRGGAVGRDGS